MENHNSCNWSGQCYKWAILITMMTYKNQWVKQREESGEIRTFRKIFSIHFMQILELTNNNHLLHGYILDMTRYSFFYSFNYYSLKNLKLITARYTRRASKFYLISPKVLRKEYYIWVSYLICKWVVQNKNNSQVCLAETYEKVQLQICLLSAYIGFF